MNFLEKSIKIKSAFINAIIRKDNTTDIIYHLQKTFQESSNKKIFKIIQSSINIEGLKAIELIKETPNSIDKRSKEYRVEELNKLYQKYVNHYKEKYGLNFEEFIAEEIVDIILENTYYDEEFLHIIKRRLDKKFEKIFGKQIGRNIRIDLTFTKTTSYPFYNELLNVLDLTKTNIDGSKYEINKESLNQEINFIYNLFKILNF